MTTDYSYSMEYLFKTKHLHTGKDHCNTSEKHKKGEFKIEHNLKNISFEKVSNVVYLHVFIQDLLRIGHAVFMKM